MDPTSNIKYCFVLYSKDVQLMKINVLKKYSYFHANMLQDVKKSKFYVVNFLASIYC
jgi:hypothetical protein